MQVFSLGKPGQEYDSKCIKDQHRNSPQIAWSCRSVSIKHKPASALGWRQTHTVSTPHHFPQIHQTQFASSSPSDFLSKTSAIQKNPSQAISAQHKGRLLKTKLESITPRS